MATHRQARINEEMAHELAIALRQIQDPRIAGSLVSVTEVDCAKDLKTARVYYSFLQQKHTEKEVRKALVGASGYLRSHLARTLNLRETPQLTFIFDDSMERGNRISAILREVTAEFEENRAPKESAENGEDTE
ncbi:MAG: 30S ribosome-binding factor RbfA [Clostridia bacterium]|nr:30S ribosome-binding factor RbfA [Clostridia bacterium]